MATRCQYNHGGTDVPTVCRAVTGREAGQEAIIHIYSRVMGLLSSIIILGLLDILFNIHNTIYTYEKTSESEVVKHACNSSRGS